MKSNQNYASLWLTVTGVVLASALVACGSSKSSKKDNPAPTQTTVGTGFAAAGESGAQSQNSVKVIADQTQQQKETPKPVQQAPGQTPNQGKGCDKGKDCSPKQQGPGQNSKPHQHPGQFHPPEVSCNSVSLQGLLATCGNNQVCQLSTNAMSALGSGVCIKTSTNCLGNESSGFIFFSDSGNTFLQVWGTCEVSLYK